MKTSALVFSVSLAANLALGAAVLLWSPQGSTAKPQPSPPANAPAATAVSPAAGSSTPVPAVSTGVWSQLRDQDLATVAARLRAAGFPPSMLRAVIGPLLGERFAARRRELEAAAEKPFWKKQSEAVDPMIQAELTALGRKQRDLYRQLLGDDIGRLEEDDRIALRQEFGIEFAPEKRRLIEAWRSAGSDRITELQEKMGPVFSSGDQEKMRELQRQQHDELAKILSPAELFEYDLRNSYSASQVRFALAALHPTEAEFRTLFPLQQALDQQFPSKPGANTAQDLAPRQAATVQMDEQIKVLLGPERFAEYQLSRNYDYQQTAKVIDRLNLPAQTTAQVYAVQQDIQRRISALRTASPEDRAVQNAALAAEATQKISALIGSTGLEAYQQYGGQWLQRLQPAARPRANPNKR